MPILCFKPKTLLTVENNLRKVKTAYSFFFLFFFMETQKLQNKGTLTGMADNIQIFEIMLI